ncbi:MAG: hypothetical protein ACRC3B_08215, partial [Bacteroidia bacterium]
INGKTELIVKEFPNMNKLESIGHSYTKTYVKNMLFFKALAYYVTGKYKESLKILVDELSDENSGSGRYRFLLRAMTLRLIIHCDQKNDDTVEVLTQGLIRFLNRENCMSFPEGEFCQFFLNWTGKTENARQKLFKKTIQKIKTRFEEQSDWQFAVSNRFFLAWLIKNSENISYNDALLQWNVMLQKTLSEKIKADGSHS